MPDPAVLLEAGAKTLLYASLLIAIGSNTLHWLLLPRCGAELDAARVRAVEQSSARIALWAAIGALGACVLRVWTHTVSAFGFSDASLDNIKLIALESRWGLGWKAQTCAALLLVVASAITARRQAAWPAATVAALLFAATIPLLGHAAGDFFREALHSIHILSAGVWLGTLAVVLLVRVPCGNPDSPGAVLSAGHLRRTILRRFSSIALPSAATAVAAGIVAAYLYIGAFANLWTTAYGRLLLVKIALVGMIAGCGFFNWRRLKRPHSGGADFFAIILLEAAIAAAVVLVTAFLTETAHPG